MLRGQNSSHQVKVKKLCDSQITVSPKFMRLSTENRSSNSPRPLLEPELCLKNESLPLLAGVPDDVALNCLLRVPVEYHTVCKAVCTQWYQLFGSKQKFFTCRKEIGFRDPWLFVLSYRKYIKKIEWQVVNLRDFSWHSIPAMPCREENVFHHGFICVSIPEESTLIVCGGVFSDTKCPLDTVMKYEALKNRWTIMKKMITARSFFGSEVIDGMIYVAGGSSSDLSELGSGEVMDPHTETWHSIACMETKMESYGTAVLNGRLLVTEGWSWPFERVPEGQIYDPRTDNWERMPVGMREGWIGSSVVLYGHLFVVSENERIKLKVYDASMDCWEPVEGPPLPEQIRKPFSVNCNDDKIYVVGRDCHIAVGHISRLNPEIKSAEEWRFSVQWQVVYAPKALSPSKPTNKCTTHLRLDVGFYKMCFLLVAIIIIIIKPSLFPNKVGVG